MADLAGQLSREHGLPVLDGVVCAVKLAESLHALGLHTSKTGSYAAPRAKRFVGFYAPLSPSGDPEPVAITERWG
jgi:allantoin racemase